MVDPISAFCDQLKEYDRECRAFGYLTAVDNEEKSGMKDNGSGSEKTNAHECGHGSLDNNGNKRPINNTGDIERINKHDEGENSQKKRRVAGPAIGPAIGPARGPSTFPTNDPKNVTATGTGPTDDRKKIRVICPVKSNRPAIGPTMPPSIGPSIGPAKPVKMPIRPAPPEKSD